MVVFLLILFGLIIYLIYKNENQAHEILDYKIKENSIKYNDKFMDASFYDLFYYWQSLRYIITNQKNELIEKKINRFKCDEYLELLGEYYSCYSFLENKEPPDYADPLDIISINYVDEEFNF